jgi:hypothetical protein
MLIHNPIKKGAGERTTRAKNERNFPFLGCIGKVKISSKVITDT